MLGILGKTFTRVWLFYTRYRYRSIFSVKSDYLWFEHLQLTSLNGGKKIKQRKRHFGPKSIDNSNLFNAFELSHRKCAGIWLRRWLWFASLLFRILFQCEMLCYILTVIHMLWYTVQSMRINSCAVYCNKSIYRSQK